MKLKLFLVLFLCSTIYVNAQSEEANDVFKRIIIDSPTDQTIIKLSKLGIDLSCGTVFSDNYLRLEVNNYELDNLTKEGIPYSVDVEDLTKFYSERAAKDLPFAKSQLELGKKKRSLKNKQELVSKSTSSISNVIISNPIQYTGENEVDWAEPTNFSLGNWAGCLTYSEMKSELDDMYTYSETKGLNIVSQKANASSTGQTTWGNPKNEIINNGLRYRGQGIASSFENDLPEKDGVTFWEPETIWYVRITGNQSSTSEGTKPQMLFTSMIHSREVSALMNNIYFMWYIVENYGSDPAITELVDNNELYFVPVVNPDGLRWNEHLDARLDNLVDDGAQYQRKNLRPNTGGTGNTSNDRGVDLNRNFDYFWGYNNVGSTGDPSGGTYRGPSRASEPETQIMVDFITTRSIKSSVWNHSYANSVPHPYGGVPSQSSGREDEYYRWHEEMTRYNRYLYGATIFYESNGLPDDWMMGGAADNNGSTGSGQGIIATTPEHGGEGFWPTPSTIVPIAKQSMRISLATVYYGGKYAKLHDLTQSNITETTNVDLDFGIERIGQTASDFTVTVTPISSNILSIVSPPTESGIPINTTTNPSLRSQKNVTAIMQLSPAITANEKIEYNVKLSNDNGVIYEANYEKYYQPFLLFEHIPDATGLTGWTQSGGWTNTASDAYSGANSINTGTYANSTTKTLTTTNSYDFSNSNEVLIQFYSKWDIERNYDFVEVLGSSDGGSSWVSLSGKYTKPNATSAVTSHDNKSGTYANFQANSSGQIYDGDRMDNWVMEEITIDNTYSTLLNSTNVKFRFIFRTDGLNVNENYTTTNDGFFIDDFKVIKIQDPCSAVSVPANLNASSVTQTTASIAWDEIASVIYDLRYKEFGTSNWRDVFDINSLDYQLSGLDPSTQYEIQLRSKCNDANASNYSSSINFTTLAIVPCTGTVISSFPYNENLNSGIGDWTNTDGGWTSHYGTTTSSSTGPSSDADGGTNTSSRYLYTESSTGENPGPGGTTELVSPCFDLTGLSTADFKFKYHMYGSSMGTLSVQISADNGGSWLDTIFKDVTGNSNEWLSASINLDSYLESSIKIKFIGKTGASYRSDMAIDNFELIAVHNEVWTGTTNSDWETATNWSPVIVPQEKSNITIPSGLTNYPVLALGQNITIASGASLTINPSASLSSSGSITNNGQLILESSATKYSSLIANAITGTGKVNYKRHVNIQTNGSRGNDLVSAPLSGQAFNNFVTSNSNLPTVSGNTMLFGSYNNTTNPATYNTFDNTDTDLLTAGVGYRTGSTNNSSFTFSGTVNTSNVLVGITSPAGGRKWNLIGNPYPSYLKVNDGVNGFLSNAANKALLADDNVAIYGYNATDTGGIWTIYNLANTDGNTLLAPGQAFFVASKAETGGNIQFTPEMRSIGAADDFIQGKSNNENANLKLQITSDSNVFSTDFYFNNNSTLGLDLGYDAAVFGGNAPKFAIYSHLVNENVGRDLGIQSLNTKSVSDVIIPLGINAVAGEQVKVSIATSTLPEDVFVYLEDNEANKRTLLNTDDYTFTAAENLTTTGRFFLSLKPSKVLAVDDLQEQLNNLVVYTSTLPKAIFIKGQLNDVTTLSLYDIQGRNVLTKILDQNNTTNQIDVSRFNTGIYIVYIKSNTIHKTKKVIIR